MDNQVTAIKYIDRTVSDAYNLLLKAHYDLLASPVIDNKEEALRYIDGATGKLLDYFLVDTYGVE